ncbi:MAG: hypothetical protein DRJ96_08350 [Thermoprotei archaeon]|nr:MAG: hypothetical protein DRJ67_09555 [Thermoprotei archaeon]RLE95570.1 MAG: hypothetical protein DRJ96_08350 [Thermoprotei archaeon]
MVNRRYERGRRFEHRVRRLLEAAGWVVIRAAGSRPIDLVAMKRGAILMIECKKGGRISREQMEYQAELARRAGATYIVVTPRNLGELKRLLGVA